MLSLVEAGAAWVITSSEALRNLQAMLQAAENDAGTHAAADSGAGAISGLRNASVWRTMQQQTLIIPHPRIAETAQALGFDTVLRTGSGDDALIAAVQAIQSRS